MPGMPRAASTAEPDAYPVVDVRVAGGAPLRADVPVGDDLILLVLEGELDVRCGDEHRVLAAGDQIVLPHAVPRRIRAIRDAWALCLGSPAVLATA
jgi:quercetin dioxygenase-like cupin family protein